MERGIGRPGMRAKEIANMQNEEFYDALMHIKAQRMIKRDRKRKEFYKKISTKIRRLFKMPL